MKVGDRISFRGCTKSNSCQSCGVKCAHTHMQTGPIYTLTISKIECYSIYCGSAWIEVDAIIKKDNIERMCSI